MGCQHDRDLRKPFLEVCVQLPPLWPGLKSEEQSRPVDEWSLSGHRSALPLGELAAPTKLGALAPPLSLSLSLSLFQANYFPGNKLDS